MLRTALLFIVYWLVVTPIGLVLRRFGDPMGLRFPGPKASYWVEIPDRAGT